MFIQTEATPNPATLKFLPGREVLGEGRAADFPDEEAARRSPLAMRLFAVDGVSGVFFGSDFVTVTKSGGEWQHLKPALLGAIMEHFTGGAPILFGDAGEADAHDGHAVHEGENADIVREIKDVLDTRIRPAVAQDGGDITFQGYEDGVVFLAMQGSCAGCPSSTLTLKKGVENTLKHYVPEVVEVRAV
ncbi:NifU family protein [Parvibaculum sp.]|uniref:NifU family protein n=1 Tax=Parvibaculum sp. TaxID=2024848 RepID=UPI002C5E4C18|nr:NifU family protein [Parvibaculum sp.]HUD51508.1 NifU family protein [Parvibaculum sp.]